MKKKWVDAYMDVAERFAELSTAKRLHVGSIIVKDNRIISIGYNGTPAGWDNNCEDADGYTLPQVIHAEMNAISKLAQSVESGLGATMFVTHAPCVECAKGIYGAGVKKVYYKNDYRYRSGIEFLTNCGIEVEKII